MIGLSAQWTFGVPALATRAEACHGGRARDVRARTYGIPRTVTPGKMKERSMLTLTDNARYALQDIATRAGLPDDGG